MSEKEMDTILIRMGFCAVEHCEDEGERYYHLKAWFKVKENESPEITDGNCQLVADKNNPEKIINRAQTVINHLINEGDYEIVRSYKL